MMTKVWEENMYDCLDNIHGGMYVSNGRRDDGVLKAQPEMCMGTLDKSIRYPTSTFPRRLKFESPQFKLQSRKRR